MRARQQGITAIAFIVVVAFVGVFAFAVLKVMPFYMEQMKVVSILEDVKNDLDGNGASIVEIRNAITKRLDIEMVTGVQAREFEIAKTNAGFTVHAKYERRAPYLANLYLVAAFDEQVEIKR